MQIDDLGKPIETEDFDDFLEEAYKYLNVQQEYCKSFYRLGEYEKWFYDQATGLLTFSNKDIVQLEIDYEKVGSISKISNTWLWAWANPHLLPTINSEIIKVLEFGEENEFERLTKRKWYADEYDGWEMTAIAAYILKAKGAYRIPTENTFSFLIFKNIRDFR